MKEFNREEREDLFVTALEGGSNYWYYLKLSEDFFKDTKESDSIHIFNKIYENEKIDVYDRETGRHIETISLYDFNQGDKLFSEQYTELYDSIKEGEVADADIADLWFQLVVLKEIIYG